MLLLALSLYLWYRNRDTRKVFYSTEEYEKFQLNTFPYKSVFKKKVPWFAWLRNNYLCDVPYLVEITGFPSGDEQQQVVKKRLWKVAPKTSVPEFNNSLMKENLIHCVKKNNTHLPDEQQKECIVAFGDWLGDIYSVSKLEHVRSSMIHFLTLLNECPDDECANIILDKTDFSLVRTRMVKNIRENYREKKGIKIYLHYKRSFFDYNL